MVLLLSVALLLAAPGFLLVYIVWLRTRARPPAAGQLNFWRNYLRPRRRWSPAA